MQKQIEITLAELAHIRIAMQGCSSGNCTVCKPLSSKIWHFLCEFPVSITAKTYSKCSDCGKFMGANHVCKKRKVDLTNDREKR